MFLVINNVSCIFALSYIPFMGVHAFATYHYLTITLAYVIISTPTTREPYLCGFVAIAVFDTGS